MNAISAAHAMERLGGAPDVYGRLLERALFPLWEGAVRRRPTVRRLAFLERSQWSSLDELIAIQTGALRRLLRHAYDHVPLYRKRLREAGMTPDDVREPADLRWLPILSREEARELAQERTATAPPYSTVEKATGGTLGKPLVFSYNGDSEVWRQATKLRAYAWAGYTLGSRSLHYWGRLSMTPPLGQRLKGTIDHVLKRQRYVDCTPRTDAHLEAAVRTIRRHRPHVIVTYSQAGAALARYINRTGARTWDTIPVLCGAERLLPVDRDVMEKAFGPALFETYGSREFMLVGSECDAHDGLHVSMENLIVELVVREGGHERPARPGEIGEIVVTDLHNLSMPFIRYAQGDLAMARVPERCACGRELLRIGPIEGRVTETLRDRAGNPVSGLLFSLLFVEFADVTRQFQVIQHRDRSVTLKIVPGARLRREHIDRMRSFCSQHLPGVEIRTALVDDIPPTRSGKRQIVVVES